MSSGETGIFDCVSSCGFTHALILPIGANETAVFLAPGSALIRRLLDNKTTDHNNETYNNVMQLVDVYRKMCVCMSCEADEKAAELLKQNSLRFSRATRHFNYYILSVAHHLSAEQKHELVDFLVLSREILKHFTPKISPLGYRMSIKFGNLFPLSIIHKRSFISVFVSLIAVALKIADDHELLIEAAEEDMKLVFNYHFKTSDPQTAHFAYMDELKFADSICDDNSWGFSWIVPIDRESAVIRLTIPIILDNNTMLRASDSSDFNVLDEEAISMLEEEFSLLYFNSL